jgi:hypothetical protein
MILDCAQLLSSAHIMLDGRRVAERRVPVVERPTFINHPCARWVREARANYIWTGILMGALAEQFELRFGKPNALADYAAKYLANWPYNIDLREQTEFACVVPVEYERRTVVDSYRTYYFEERQDQAVWTVVGAPDWWKRMRGDVVQEVRHAS